MDDPWTKLGVLAGIGVLVITYLGTAYQLHWPPFTRVPEHHATLSSATQSPRQSPSRPSSSPAPRLGRSALSAGTVAQNITGDLVSSGRYDGATVTSATCYQGTAQLWSDGTTHAECDLSLSAGPVFRAAVIDGNLRTTFFFQYQDNLSADSIANDVTGDTVNSGINQGASVESASCYGNTIQQWSNGETHAECNLELSDGASLQAEVIDNGLTTSFQF